MKFVETAGDIAVKDKLFNSTMSEVTRFANKHRQAHIVGSDETDEQKDILCAAKMKVYNMGFIRKVSSMIRRNMVDTEYYSNVVGLYRDKLKL